MLYLKGWLLCSLAFSAIGCSGLSHSGKPVAEPWGLRENAGYCQTRWTSLVAPAEPYPVQLSQRRVVVPSDELAVIVSAREPQLVSSSQWLPAHHEAPLQADEHAVREAQYVRPASFDYFQP